MIVVPVTLKQAREFINDFHRHNHPPTGWKFGCGIRFDGKLVGVAVASRPVARHLDDGLTIEVCRSCTGGTRNANSMLYGAIWRAARALGYVRGITYTRADESGASLRASGWVRAADLPARAGWAESTKCERLRMMRDPVGAGGVSRIRWEKVAI